MLRKTSRYAYVIYPIHTHDVGHMQLFLAPSYRYAPANHQSLLSSVVGDTNGGWKASASRLVLTDFLMPRFTRKRSDTAFNVRNLALVSHGR